MKSVKNAMIVLLCCLPGPLLFGQKFGAGVHGGYNLSSLQINNPQIKTYKGYGGAMVGAWMRYGGMFYIQPELNYHFSRSEVTYSSQDGLSTHSGNLNTHYLQAVLAPGVRPINSKMFQLRLGPAASYSVMIDENLRKLDLKNSQLKTGAWHAGFFTGVNVWRFSVDVRYFVSLNNQSSIPDQRFKSNTFQAALGFTLFGR